MFSSIPKSSSSCSVEGKISFSPATGCFYNIFLFFPHSLNVICLGISFVCILLGICITFWIWVVFNQLWEILDHHLLIYCLCSFFLPTFEVPVMYILNIFMCFTHLLCFFVYFSIGFDLCASGLDIFYCLVFHFASSFFWYI